VFSTTHAQPRSIGWLFLISLLPVIIFWKKKRYYFVRNVWRYEWETRGDRRTGNVLFFSCVQWVKTRGDISFCWYYYPCLNFSLIRL
jgi:hypothetical protein